MFVLRPQLRSGNPTAHKKLAMPPPLLSNMLIPVINRPEVAILVNLSLSDHRVVDGWDAANFMQALKCLIENPLKLLSMR